MIPWKKSVFGAGGRLIDVPKDSYRLGQNIHRESVKLFYPILGCPKQPRGIPKKTSPLKPPSSAEKKATAQKHMDLGSCQASTPPKTGGSRGSLGRSPRSSCAVLQWSHENRMSGSSLQPGSPGSIQPERREPRNLELPILVK